MPNPYIATALALGAKAAYSFDADTGSVVTDSTINALHGTYQNGATGTPPPLVEGGVAALDVSGAKHITVPAAAWSKTSIFSISFFIKYNTTENTVVMERNQNVGLSVQIQTAANANGLVPNGAISVVSTVGGVARTLVASSAQYANNLPHHVVLVIGATLPDWKVYVDGVAVTVYPFDTTPIPTPSYGATTFADIGSRAGSAGFGGVLDDVVFFDRVLNAAEVSALYNANSGTGAPHRYWRLINLAPYNRHELEVAEIQLGYLAEQKDALASISATVPPTTGFVSNIHDGDLATSAKWSSDVVRTGGFALNWDFGVDTLIDGFRVAGISKNSALAFATLQYTDDLLTWFTVASPLTQLRYRGNNVFTKWPSEDQESDPSFNLVPLLLNFEGANESVAIVDESASPKSLTAFNGAQITTAQFKYGASSVFFDGANDYISAPSSSAFNIAGDFAFEGWIRPINVAGVFVFMSRQDPGASIAIQFRINSGKLEGVLRPDGSGAVLTIASTTSITPGTWNHVAFTRQGSTARIFLNGVLEATGTQAGSYSSANAVFTLGCLIETGTPPTSFYGGYLDSFRFTNGNARYTASFTPPTKAYAGISLESAFETATVHPSISDATAFARVPNFDPIQGRIAQTSFVARDVEFGGRGTIMGTVKEKGTVSDTPVRKRVRLFRDRDGLFVRETFSHPTTGAYVFEGVDETITYSVVSYDNNANFRAVIADRVTPSIL